MCRELYLARHLEPSCVSHRGYAVDRVFVCDHHRPVFTASDVGTTCGNSGSPFFSSDLRKGSHDVVGAVIASITRGKHDACGYSQVTAVRTARLANAVHAFDPAARRM